MRPRVSNGHRQLSSLPARGSAPGWAFGFDGSIEALRRELLPAPVAREETRLVFPELEVDQPCVVKLRRRENHSDRPFPACASSGDQ